MKKTKVKLIPFNRLKNKWLKNHGFKRAYDDLELEFKIIDAIIAQRIKDGVTQEELAKKVGTKQSAIARFESGRYNPSLIFINKLSQALDLRLQVTSNHK